MNGKLIFFTGVYDTLDLFTYQLEKAFAKMGYETLIIDTNHMAEGLYQLASYVQSPVKAAITFNNLGFNLELVQGKNIWDDLGIICVNILVDHPRSYRTALQASPKNAAVLCIDRNHMKYVQRFFSDIPITGFLPHGGKMLNQKPLPIQKREIDLMYAGRLARAFVQNIMPDFSEFDFDLEFIAGQVYEKLTADILITTEEAVEETLQKNDILLSDPELSYVISQLHYVELLAASFYREKLIRTMLERGMRVHLYGAGWEICDFVDHPNLIWEGEISAEEVLAKMQHSKIVLSSTTWFKDGMHERVSNGMLAGAVVATDESVFMREEFLSYPQEEASELILYKLSEIKQLADLSADLLKRPEVMQKIADRGRKKAMEKHTWECRAEELQKDLLAVI